MTSTPKTPKRPLRLVELIDLEAQLVRDKSLDRQELRRRDRRIGTRLATRDGDRRSLFLGWLSEARDPTRPLPGKRAEQALSLVKFMLAVAGAAIGWGAAMALFRYDGTRPINVIHVLGVFVGLQLALLLLLGIVVTPPRWLAWLPGASGAQESLRLLSPGRWAARLGRMLPESYRQPFDEGLGSMTAYDRLYERLRLWQMVHLSQVFAVSFNLGALLGAAVLVAFSDLAFAWSSTLQVDAETLHRAVRAMAAPWSWALPEAAPTERMVAATRYYRLTDTYMEAGGDASTPMGPPLQVALRSMVWWSFLLMSMIVYGLVPRALAQLLAWWRLRRALGAVGLDHTGYDRLYERLTEPLFESVGADAASPPDAMDAGPTGTRVAGRSLGGGGPVVVMDWGPAELDEGAIRRRVSERFGAQATALFAVGGMDVAADRHALEAVAQTPDDVTALVLVKVWESPTRDFRNFLGALREALGDGRAVVVAPTAWDGAGEAEFDDEDWRQWDRAARSLGDPWLRVE